MSENETTSTSDRESILNQVKSELVKQRRESLKGKLKELLKKRDEAMKAVAVIDRDIEKELADFEAGL